MRIESRPIAFGAVGNPHEFFEPRLEHRVGGLSIDLEKLVSDPGKDAGTRASSAASDLGTTHAVEQGMALFGLEIFPRDGDQVLGRFESEGEEFAERADGSPHPFAHVGPLADQLDRTCPNRFGLVTDQKIFGKGIGISESFASRACALGGVETEELRGRRRVGYAALRAGV